MDGSASCPNKHFGDTSCKFHVNSLSCDIQVDHVKFTFSNIEEPTEVLSSPGFFVHDVGLGELTSDPSSTSDRHEQDNSKANEKEYSHSIPLDANKKKGLSKSATFPSSAVLLCTDGSAILPNAEEDDKCPSTLDSSVYTRSVSFPATFKLVSAMKGSRAQNVSCPTMKLHVKWAPDVYDPPATSMLPTMKKSHHQRPRLKKKESSKYKPNKGKSSRGNSERRTANQSSCTKMAETVDTRSKAVVDRLIMTGYSKSNAGVLEYAVSNQDSKCGSSLLEGLAKVHISVGEAS